MHAGRGCSGALTEGVADSRASGASSSPMEVMAVSAENSSAFCSSSLRHFSWSVERRLRSEANGACGFGSCANKECGRLDGCEEAAPLSRTPDRSALSARPSLELARLSGALPASTMYAMMRCSSELDTCRCFCRCSRMCCNTRIDLPAATPSGGLRGRAGSTSAASSASANPTPPRFGADGGAGPSAPLFNMERPKLCGCPASFFTPPCHCSLMAPREFTVFPRFLARRRCQRRRSRKAKICSAAPAELRALWIRTRPSAAAFASTSTRGWPYWLLNCCSFSFCLCTSPCSVQCMPKMARKKLSMMKMNRMGREKRIRCAAASSTAIRSTSPSLTRRLMPPKSLDTMRLNIVSNDRVAEDADSRLLPTVMWHIAAPSTSMMPSSRKK
mmetsp:Transcript_25297/g.63784  ORF Transcript_25297/g.63784 Transcript_25297/m.63784 type:complete len:388 (-) Transcript_25297:2220-3383(-)